ncbi:hypothetical protein MPSEU_000808700 [Mayamaea pseudoterrestris]|nr:hypothetical protein MPSEU_000808700 [Mayamaea pseudoterrestris]
MIPRMTISAATSTTSSLLQNGVSPFLDFAQVAAPLSSIILCLSPIPTMQQISKDKSVGTLPLLPYSSMLANAFVWTCYGVMKREPKIWIANGPGIFLGLFYMLKFIKHSPKSAPTLPGSVQQHFQVALSIIVATLLVALSPLKHKSEIVGRAAVAICIALFASPLASLKTVIDNKSAASIALPLSIAMTVNGFLWTSVGALRLNDYNVVIPSFLGFVSGLTQIFLKLMYGNGKIKVQDLPI